MNVYRNTYSDGKNRAKKLFLACFTYQNINKVYLGFNMQFFGRLLPTSLHLTQIS